MDQLRIKVSDLLEVGGAERKLTLSITIPDIKKGSDQIELVSPSELDLILTHVDHKILAQGKLKTEALLDCSRCLKEFKYPIRTQFSELFAEPSQFREGEWEDIEERRALSIIDGEIDLTFLVEQAILLALPMKPLCDKFCKGLCSVCGKDLNEEPHPHGGEKIDSRLTSLKEFFKKSNT